MELDESLKKVISNLSPGESIRMIGALISEVLSAAERANQGIRQTFNIPVNEIDLFPDHPFYVEADDDMSDLVKSIKKYGMITPGVVRPKDNGRYELLSGHRRLWACKLAGIDYFRCEVLDLSDEEALIFMIESNRQRPKLHPCEKGQIYRLIQENKNPCEDLRNMRIEAGDTLRKIKSCINLCDLIPELQELVDERKLSLNPAAALSGLPHEYQKIVFDKMEYEQCRPTHEQAVRMKRLNDNNELTPEIIADVLEEEKSNQKAKIVLSGEKAFSYIPADIPEVKQEEYILKALEYYQTAGGHDGERSNQETKKL